jgi:hypothetical protein
MHKGEVYMSFRIHLHGFAALLVALIWSGSVEAQPFYLAANSGGGELQIGTGLPLPVGPAGIFLGGKAPATAGTPFWPPLLVDVDTSLPNANWTMSVMQGLSTAQGGKITFPPGLLAKAAVPAPLPIAVFTTNPAVYQVRTTLSFSWPAAAAVFAPGGAPGAAATTVVIPGPGPGTITYSGSAKAFGGPAQFALRPGPLAGVIAGPAILGPNGLGVPPIATVWINAFAKLPASATKALVAGASAPLGVAQPGAPLAAPAGTTMWGMGGIAAGLAGNVGPMGTILASVFVAAAVPSNMVTASKGYPWTTGLITVSQPAAAPAEIFFLSGTDMRVAGVGNVSLVSGALSTRLLSGPNANRGWLSLNLPEPTAALGSVAALAMLGLCHGVVRRRSR